MKRRVARIIHCAALGIAFIVAAAMLSLVSPSLASAASPAYVQGAFGQAGSGTTASVAFPGANTAGNLIAVDVVWDNTGTVTVSDSKGNIYTPGTARQTWGSNWSSEVFYTANILGGANTVKATFGTALSSFGIVYVHEYSGLATASPVDVSASAVGTAASMSSGAVSTTSANDLLFAAGASANAVTAPGTGFTSRLTGAGNLTEDRVAATTGSYAGTATQNGTSWVMQLVAFRAATTTVGPSTKLAFVQGPSNATAGAAITPAVRVAVEDANGNIETSDNTTQVTLAIGTNPAAGTLSGGSAVTVASGIATFSGLSINKPGTGYTLTASSTPTYTAATSAAFNITTGTAASPAYVQGAFGQAGSGTTASVAFPGANTAGNLIAVDVVWDNTGTVTVSDSKGNIYTPGTARQTWGSNWSSEVFYTANILGGANTVKATFGTALSSFGIVYVHEYSGLATASPVDVSASAVGTAASMSSGAVSTTSANDLLFAAGASANAVTAPGTGFTSRLTGAGNLTEDRVAATTGSYAGTATQNGTSWVMQLVAFRAATTTVGPSTKLAFVQGPSNATAGAAITPAVRVAVEDANGNIETSDNTTQVTLAIGTNPAAGTLSGGSAVTVASGIATFSGLSINTAGTGYTLTASSTPTYTAATSAAFNITASTSPADWTTYLGGVARTGFAADANGFSPSTVPNLGLAWQTADAGPSHGVFSQPIVSNGLVYWGSFDGYERATTTSGNLVWQTNLGTDTTSGCTDPSEAGVASTATVTTDVPVDGASSVLYVGGDANLYALNAATGAVLWSYSVGPNSEYFIWSSPLVYGNSVYIGVASFGGGTDSGSSCPEVQGQLVQLNRVTGALQNTFDVVPNGCQGGGVWSSPMVDAAAGTIYFGTGSKPAPGGCTNEPLAAAVVELNASDLSLVGSWAVPPAQQSEDSDFGATPTLFNGVIGGVATPLVGVINKNGTFYAFKRDALGNGPVWQTQIAIGGGDPTVGQGDVASASFDGTTLYVGGDATASCSGSLNALNPSTGAFIWQHCFTDGGFVLGGVTSTSGGVVGVGEGNNIALFNAATGASLFTYAGAGTFWGPPSIAGGTLYEGDMSGNLYALTMKTTVGPSTKLAFVQGPSNATAGAAITPAVRVAVEDANGNIETSDNTTQVTLAIGTNPAAGTLSGGSAVTVASGIATFSGLSINKPGTGYTLTASSTPTYTAATSAAFNITTGTAASPAYVQGAFGQAGSGTTASVAFPGANTAGNLIAVDVVWDNTGTVTVSDSKGNIYTPGTARQTWGSNWSSEVFYTANILGGANTVKATFGTALSSFGIVYVHEYSGLATASPVDVSASAVGTAASMSSGAVSTTSANDLLFAAGASANAVTAPGTGFTSRLTGAGNLTEDRVAATTGSYAGTATQNGTSWVMQLVAFRAA